MNISRLETFVKLAAVNSFSQVAEELQLTQPAISIQIKNLEEFFGVQLVERGFEGVTLTPEGQLLLKEAKEIIRRWQSVRQKINKLKELVKGDLRICASTIPAEYILPRLIVDFCHNYPLVKLKMEVKDSKMVIQEILKKRADLGIVGVKPSDEKLFFTPISFDQMVLIVPLEHPLAKRTIVTPKELIEHRFILREEGSGTRKATSQGLAQIGLKLEDLQIVAQLGSTEAIIAAVEAGLGLAIISSLAVSSAARKIQQLKVINIEGFQVIRHFYLIYGQKSQENQLVQKFVESIREKI